MRAATDLRMPLLGLAAWWGSLAVALAGRTPLEGGRWRWLGVVMGLTLIGIVLAAMTRSGTRSLGAVVLLVALAAGVIADVHAVAVATDPVAQLAGSRQWVSFEGVVTSDPRIVTAARTEGTLVYVRVEEVSGRLRGEPIQAAVRAPVVVLGSPAWRAVRLGSRIRGEGRLAPASDAGVAAILTPSGAGPSAVPTLVKRPDLMWRAAAALRHAIRRSVDQRPPDQAALVPALVDGDDASVDEGLAADFRVTGLTHLMAVSGTNLTLLLVALLWAARWLGVRGRWLTVVAASGIAGFVVLARGEPSVVRAAAMGTVGLIALGTPARGHAFRALGVAVLVLILVNPGLATSIGFALSVVATAGILGWAPAWRDALATWMPRPLAEMIAVPLAAQLACTPVIAALSGRVSLVAVAANLVAEPVVGPATVLGLAAGLVTLVIEPLGQMLGFAAGLCCGWIALVARRGADLTMPEVGWGTSPLALILLAGFVMALAWWGPRWATRPLVVLVAGTVLLVVMTIRPPATGWPPSGWEFAACDVGQGDGLVVSTGPGRAIVVDAGPDPRIMDRCLDGLGVTAVDLLVLTHFHADHVDGIAGVASGRRINAIETTRLQEPPGGVSEVADLARRLDVRVLPAADGSTRRFGDVTVQVMWPPSDYPSVGPGDGSTANESSVVLLVQTPTLRLLLTGDVEPLGQAILARQLAGLRVDVLKVPHHGSRYQDMAWLCSLGARIGVISVGADNDYGHPAHSTVEGLTQCGVQVHRTDIEGNIAITADGGTITSRS